MFNHVSAAVDEILSRLGKECRLATPLGLGKPNALLNEIYARAKRDPGLRLEIYTALSLDPPCPESELARRFFGPFAERQWGKDYPRLDYAVDSAAGHLPGNIKVHEFYFGAGSALRSPGLQRDYQSINYTHVAEGVYQRDVRVLVQLIARGRDSESYSLSCNPDVTLDLVDLYQERGRPLLVVGVVHPDMPFLGGEAEVGPDFFDILLEDPDGDHQLFALPRLPIGDVDHAIGFYVSQLVADEGTLQIGIGSLSDAVVSSLLMRHPQNALFSSLVDECWGGRIPSAELGLERGPFASGLYGLSAWD